MSLLELAREGRDGLDWYAKATADIETLCNRRGWASDTFCGVLAVTSPRVSVARNLRITLQWMQTGDLFQNVMTTIRQSLNHYLSTGEIRGPKTGPFYAALRGDSDAVVLDVWMAKVFGIAQSEFSKKSVRDRCKRSIRLVARKTGQSPRDTQAAIWTAAVRREGRAPGRFNLFREHANMVAYGGRFPDSGAIPHLADAYGRYQPALF